MNEDCRLCGLPVDELAYERYNGFHGDCEARNHRMNER